MTLEIRSRTEHVDDSEFATFAFGRKWGVDGVTEIDSEMRRALITVRYTRDTYNTVITLATAHERGHASVARDVDEGYSELSTSTRFERLGNYDRWQNEVEAWLRGCANIEIDQLHEGQFMLDALNTYRRSLGVSEEDWVTAREVLLDGIVVEYLWQMLRQYEPLEPDPNDEHDDNCIHESEYVDDDDWENSEPVPESGGNTDEFEPGDDEPEPDQDPISTEKHARGQNQLDWMSPEIAERVMNGESIESLANEFNLDPTNLPPLLKAFVL